MVAPPGRDAHWCIRTAFVASAPWSRWSSRCSLPEFDVFIASSSLRPVVAVTGRDAHCQKLRFPPRASHCDLW
ncbi:hypothetical protein ACOSQ3_007281 [Xanthoceras sorbifolium]